MFWDPIVHKDNNATYQHETNISSEIENEKTFEEYTNEQWNEVLNPSYSLYPNTQVIKTIHLSPVTVPVEYSQRSSLIPEPCSKNS